MRDEHDRYEVGYGKPPKATQFLKGKSPNPGGRPKGSKSWKTLADEVLNERITVIVQGKPRKMTMKKAITRQAVHDAIRNNDLKKLNMMGVFKEQIETPQQSIDEQPEQFSETDPALLSLEATSAWFRVQEDPPGFESSGPSQVRHAPSGLKRVVNI